MYAQISTIVTEKYTSSLGQILQLALTPEQAAMQAAELVGKDTDYKTLSFYRRSLQMLSRFLRERILQISDNRKFRSRPSEKLHPKWKEKKK